MLANNSNGREEPQAEASPAQPAVSRPHRAGEDLFIARPGSSRATIREVVKSALTRQETRVFDIIGIPGIGKTSMLIHLSGLVEHGEYSTAWLNPGEEGPPAAARDVDSSTLTRGSLALYLDLLMQLTQQQWPGNFTEFMQLRRKLLAEPIPNSNHAQAANFTLATALDQSRGFVLFMDNFHLLLKHPVANWLLRDFVPQLKRTVVVLARNTSEQRLPGSLDRVESLWLDNFTPAETQYYLQERLRGSPLLSQEHAPLDEITALIQEYTGGYPQAVALMGDLLTYRSSAPADFARGFSGWPGSIAKLVGDLVTEIERTVADAEIKQTLQKGWVVRRFDGALLRKMLGVAEGKAGNPYSDIITKLENYSFTERHGGEYRFHGFIRDEMGRQLRDTDLPEYQRLHTLAATHYAQELFGYEERQRGLSAYEAFYRYEDAEWQAIVIEWLYHLGQMGQSEAWLSFAQVYFQAFQWWGRYLKWNFCERLIDEWLSRQQLPTDQELGRAVEKFQQSYPPLSGVWHADRTSSPIWRQATHSAWEQTREALEEIRRLLKLDETHDLRSSEVGARLSLLLADSYHFDPDPSNSDRTSLAQNYYERSAQLMAQVAAATVEDRGEENDWHRAWMLYLQADLYLQAPSLGDPAETARQSIALAEQVGDPELLANNHRVLGDLSMHERLFSHAAEAYAKSIYYGYLFQTSPNPPDAYTREIYREMRGRALERAFEIWHEGEYAAAVAFSLQLQQKWHAVLPAPERDKVTALLQVSGADELSRLIMPREPDDDELGKSDSPFYYQAYTTLESVSTED